MVIGGGIGGAIGSMEGYIGGPKPAEHSRESESAAKKIINPHISSFLDNVPGGGGMATPGGGGIPKFMTAGPVLGAKLK